MGRVETIFVLAFGIVVAIFGYAINRSNVERVENMSDYYKYSVARNISHSAANIALHQMEQGDTSDTFDGAILGGTYTVTLAFAGDTVDLTSRGIYLDTSYTSVLRLKKYLKSIQNVSGALMMPLDSVGLKMQGNPTIDGRDHDINGNLQQGGTGKAGVATSSSQDSSRVAQFNKLIVGSPQVSVDTAMENPMNYLEEYTALADYKYDGGVYASNTTWGSAESPAIVVCDAGSGSIEIAGNVEGWGLLVVKGNLKISGNVTFHGLVLMVQEGEIDHAPARGVGSPTFIGAVVLTGKPGSQFTFRGNTQVMYSSAAVDNIQRIDKLWGYKLLSWYE